MIKSNKLLSRKNPLVTWIVTYTDLITLLLVFFVLLLSSSTFEQSKYEKMVESIQNSQLGDEEFASPFETLENRLNSLVDDQKLSDQVTINRHPLGLTIELNDDSIFNSGEATLKPEADSIIREIARSLLGMKDQPLQVEIEGHTDDLPINNEEFSSNWELSVFRAIDVLNRFIDYRIDRKKLKIAGYGEVRPKVPNRDAMGNPIPENRAQNRRIEIKVFRQEYRYANQQSDKQPERQ